MSNFQDIAEMLVLKKYGRGIILGFGDLGREGGDETPIGGHTVIWDSGGQGQDVRVCEVVFYMGHGVILEVASSYGDADFDVQGFTFDLIAENVENIAER